VTVAPFGTWASPLSPAALAEARVSMSGLQVTGSTCWWTESRPAEGGRQVVLRLERTPTTTGAVVVSPDDVSVRTRVHEYGGAAMWATEAGLVYSSLDDGGLWLVPSGAAPGTAPCRLTPEPAPGEVHRYGDIRAVDGAAMVVAVRERHHGDACDDEIVAVRLAGSGGAPGVPGAPAPDAVTVLAAGRDFVAAPRPSPDGGRLAWLCWDHPNMPWDGCELWVATLDAPDRSRPPSLVDAAMVDGGPAVSVGQPLWAVDGALWFASDRAGWWQPWRWRSGAAPERMCELDAEFHGPDWVLGQQTMDILPDGRLLCRFRRDGRDHVGVLEPEDATVTELAQPCVTVSAVRALPDGAAVLVGATPETTVALHLVGDDGAHEVLYRPTPTPALDPAWIAHAEPMAFETTGGVVAHALFYPPAADGIEGPVGELPPLVVLVHGGPTAACEPGLDLAVQLWTTRGVAVAAVDYRGSSGYGRAYRSLLDGAWGVADAEDCVAAARALAARGLVDGRRMAIRGSSAGGLTALRALAPGGPFAAALVSYGVTDLAALAADTHKFESRYLDRLVGPWPEAAAVYAARSPAEHPDDVDGAVLLLQGADDPIVPPDQASRLAEVLRARGLRCDHVVFDGEGHGWRRADTLARAAALEVAFLGEVLGFSPVP
jgi:dienelactone hydrolase